MTDWLASIILGVVEGVTEFLPVSSTGHLIVADALLRPGVNKAAKDAFDIAIQLGAILALIWFYRADLLGQARVIGRDQPTQRLWLGIIVAFIPAAAVGFLFNDLITTYLFSPLTVAVSLILWGVVLWIVESTPRTARTRELRAVGLGQALIIGLAQILALIPGTSRSAATIVGGLLVGLDRTVATAFSFYLSIPTLGIATLYALYKNRAVLGQLGVLNVVLGLIFAFVTALFAVGWLLRYISRHDFKGFAVYRVIAGLVILALIYLGVLQTV